MSGFGRGVSKDGRTDEVGVTEGDCVNGDWIRGGAGDCGRGEEIVAMVWRWLY